MAEDKTPKIDDFTPEQLAEMEENRRLCDIWIKKDTEKLLTR